MKHLLPLLLLLITACSGPKKTAEDKSLISAVHKLEKDPSNQELRNNLQNLYDQAAKVHLDRIELYRSLTEIDRWDKIVKEYVALRGLSEEVHGSMTASSLLSVPSYDTELLSAKQNAAAEYYERGMNSLNINDKTSARAAYYDLKKANEFVPGFRDVKQQLDIAFQNSIIKVVINPVTNNSFYRNTDPYYSNSFNEDYFQRNLVRDLGGNNNRTTPALFYTDYEARRDNIQPDWTVDITWMQLDIPQPLTSQYSRNVSKQIIAGTDTSGRPKYETVTATLRITKEYFTASGDLELRITDMDTRRLVTSNRYNDYYKWEDEYATYYGDSRALSSNDWNMINNSRHHRPRYDDVVDQLYQRIYPQVKNRIYTLVSW